MNNIKTALILAGGKGTRLRPLTYEMPKPLIPVRGRTLTEHTIDKLKEAGVENIIISVGYLGQQVIDYFQNKDLGVKIHFVTEDVPLGTGGCLKLINNPELFQDDFIVVNGDNLFDLNWEDMILLHKETKALATIALSSVEDPSAYGVADLKGNNIVNFVEKPKKEEAPSNLISSGYYIFSPKIFEILPSTDSFMLEHDVFPKVAELDQLMGYSDDGQWFDTGTFDRWEDVIMNWKK